VGSAQCAVVLASALLLPVLQPFPARNLPFPPPSAFCLYELLAEILQIGGLLALGCSISVWLAWQKTKIPPKRPYVVLAAEPLLFSYALVCGLILEYPSLLTISLLDFLHDYGVFWASALLIYCLLLAAVAIGYLAGGTQGLARLLLFALAWMGIGWWIAQPAGVRPGQSSANSVVILGFDSLSQETDDLELLRKYVDEAGGTWFQHPVTPALLTNPVWTCILAGQPASQTGVSTSTRSPTGSRSPTISSRGPNGRNTQRSASSPTSSRLTSAAWPDSTMIGAGRSAGSRRQHRTSRIPASSCRRCFLSFRSFPGPGLPGINRERSLTTCVKRSLRF